VLVVKGDGLAFYTNSADTRGAAGAQSVTFSLGVIDAAEDYHIYLAFKRADGTIVSDTSQITVTAI